MVLLVLLAVGAGTGLLVRLGVGPFPDPEGCTAQVEGTEPLLQLQWAREGGGHGNLLVEDEPDQERERVDRDQPVGLVVAREVEGVRHGSILAGRGMRIEMADPIEKTEDLADEAERGQSERTPWLVLGGVHIAVAALVAVVLAIAFTVYLLA